MPGTLLVPAGLGGVAARLEVMLEEMLEVRGLPTGRMPSMSCNENDEAMEWDGHPWRLAAGAGWADGKGASQLSVCSLNTLLRGWRGRHVARRLKAPSPLKPEVGKGEASSVPIAQCLYFIFNEFFD